MSLPAVEESSSSTSSWKVYIFCLSLSVRDPKVLRAQRLEQSVTEASDRRLCPANQTTSSAWACFAWEQPWWLMLGSFAGPLAATPSRNVGARLVLLLNSSSWKSCGAIDTALLSFFLMRGFNSIYLARPNPSQMYASVSEEDYRNQLTRRPRACLAYIFPFKLASHPPCFVLNPTAESLSSGLSEQTGKQRTPAISLWPAFTSETFFTSFFLTFSRGIWKCGDWESKRVPHNMPPWQGRLSCLISPPQAWAQMTGPANTKD